MIFSKVDFTPWKLSVTQFFWRGTVRTMPLSHLLKKKSKIIIFETAIEGRKTKKSGCGSNTWNFWLFPDLLRTYRKKKISKRSNNSRPRIKIFKMSPSRSRSDTYFGSYRWLQNLWRWWFLPRPCLVKLCHLVILSIYLYHHTLKLEKWEIGLRENLRFSTLRKYFRNFFSAKAMF